MSRVCALTGRGTRVVRRVRRRGRARAEGGVGRKVTGVTRRTQKANLQKKTVRQGGRVKSVWLSARALRTLTRGPVEGMELV